MSNLPQFTFEEGTGAKYGDACSVLMNGKMMFFGGYQESRQVSEISDCSMQLVGTLPMSFFGGGCNAFHMNDQTDQSALLCFYNNGRQQCHTLEI